VALWEFVLLGQQCKEGPYYFEGALATSTIFIALWTNHLRAAPLQNARSVARIVGGTLFDLLSFALLLIVIAIPFTFFLPTYQCYTSRARVLEAIVIASSLKTEITQRALAKKSLVNVGVGMQMAPAGRVKGGMVTREGVIIVVIEEPVAVVVLAPKMEGEEVKWECHGFPAKHMPAACRE
jgi:type IV pilus assembly protein PilA